MEFLFITESLIYYICLIIISVKIYNSKLNILPMVLNFLMHGILVICAFKLEYETFTIYFTVALIVELIVLKLSINNISIGSLFYIFLVLFSFNVILNASIISLFSATMLTKALIELATHLLMLAACLVVCCSKIADKFKNLLTWTPKGIKILVVLILLLSVIVTALAFDIKNQTKNEVFLFAIHRLLILLILSMCVALCVLILNSISNTYLKHLTKNYEKQIANQAEHYTTISKANFELRKFRHDFKNISLGVKGLISEGRTEEAVGVLESMQDEIYDATDLMLCFDTGNGIVDALLADKQRRAAAKNILIQFEGSVPSNSIVATDLCVIFGNTIDNAIEACEKIETNDTKTINVKCECGNGFMFLKITNPVNKQVTVLNNTVETTKSNKQLHGFGIYSLNQTVKKHAGNLEITCKNRKFTVDISMCLA